MTKIKQAQKKFDEARKEFDLSRERNDGSYDRAERKMFLALLRLKDARYEAIYLAGETKDNA